MQDSCTYKTYTKEVKHTKLGYILIYMFFHFWFCLELVPLDNASACIRELTRFFSRRGKPISIFSDISSSFTADEAQQRIGSRNIIWNFNPPAFPWW